MSNSRRKLSGRLGGRRGQVMLMAAVALPVLIGFMGLSVDVGYLYHTKRRMQHAADAGAMGGALELARGASGNVVAAAKLDSKVNGFDDAKAAITVTVNNPPKSGPRAGNNQFVEVIIDQTAPTFFLRVIDRETANIRARAVGGLVAEVDACVLALDPTAGGALTVSGNVTLDAKCGVMVNSTDDAALTLDGGACIFAHEVGMSGGFLQNGVPGCVEPATPVSGVPPMLDPLAYLTEPVAPFPAPLADRLSIPSGATAVLVPGVYQRGIQINGANVTFLPGTYILDGGGLQVMGNAVISGDGVTFYNTNTGPPGQWGDFTIAGTVRATLKATKLGDYAGVLFWNDPNAPDRPPGSLILGDSASVFEGAMYFPTTHVTYAGTSAAAKWTMIVADTITVTGDSQVQSAYEASDVPLPTRKATLVE